MTELPSELKRLRSLSGKTQQEVASPLGFGKSSVANWEAGRTTPTLDTIRELDNLYDARGSLVTLWIDYTSANGLPAWLRSDSELLKRAVSVEIVTRYWCRGSCNASRMLDSLSPKADLMIR